MPLFCIPELGILASLPVQSMQCSLFVMSYTTQTPVAVMIFASPVARPRSPEYIVQQSAVFLRVFIHKLVGSGA